MHTDEQTGERSIEQMSNRREVFAAKPIRIRDELHTVSHISQGYPSTLSLRERTAHQPDRK
jgi:hypothetical protein